MSEAYTDLGEYESLRVGNEVHKLRHSHHYKLIQSGPGQTLMLSTRSGYTTFRIVESGLEIPLANVASAIPKGAQLASRMSKTTGSRLTPRPVVEKKQKRKEPDDAVG
jgi:hypothetical protein